MYLYTFWLLSPKVIRRQGGLVHTAGYTLIAKYAKMIAKCKKQNNGVFHIIFFAFCTPFFVFCSILCQVRHLHEKSKDFMVYFFVALIKHEICMKYEKCRMSVSYFVACFAKYSRNEKYKKYTEPI